MSAAVPPESTDPSTAAQPTPPSIEPEAQASQSAPKTSDPAQPDGSSSTAGAAPTTHEPPSSTAASSAPAAEQPPPQPSDVPEGPLQGAIIADPNIPVAIETDESDSAYGDDELLSDTTSIPSTIMRHRWDNGRRYHKYREGEYFAPNDETQNDDLDIAHQMFLILLHGKLHLAPTVNPQKVIDLGCGTGLWCIDFADEYPSASVTGIDFSPIQPSFIPPNCSFEVDDVTAPWTTPPASFDFVNIRTLYGSVADWPALYAQIYDQLQPGGYLHQIEPSIQFKSDDGSLTPDHILSQWSDVLHEAGEKFGKSFKAVNSLGKWIREAGFQDVQETWYKLPARGWSSDPHMKELGRWNLVHCTQGAEGWALFLLTKILGWSVEETQIFVAKFKNGLKDRSVHAYLEVTVIVARKPPAREA